MLNSILSMFNKKPYKDFFCRDFFYRKFNEDVQPSALVWHRDSCNRVVKVYAGRGWKIQFDDELPRELTINEEVIIPKYRYHRLIKGEGELLLKIHCDGE